MLAALTATAVSRDWPPTVFARLVSQLGDTSNRPLDELTSELFTCLTSGTIAGPLQYEYMVVLSSDPQSVVYFPVMLHKLAFEFATERSQNIKELMCYIARAVPTSWFLSSEYKDMEGLSSSIQTLLMQGLCGDKESRILVSALTHTNVISTLNQTFPEWQTETAPLFQNLRLKSVVDDPKYPYVLANITQPSVKVPGTEANKGVVPELVVSENPDSPILHSSRALRMLWLDWLLRTSQPLDSSSLRRQIDLMWPGDRVPVVSYELCVTAFDVLAAPSALPNASLAPALTAAFITKKLPLVLREFSLPEHQEFNVQQEHTENSETIIESSTKNLDGVIARLLTTMDKDVVETVEQHHPGLREEFGIACIELGLCDPTVLHALHRSYTPQNRPEPPKSVKEFDMQKFSLYGPEQQEKLSHDILKSARGIYEPMGRHKLAELCVALYKDAKLADELFVHGSVRDFLESICVNADSASSLMEEEGCSGFIYDDLGILLGSAKMLIERYNISLPEEKAPWSTTYLRSTLFPHVSQLSSQKQLLMGQWVIALFSRSSGGIADELFRPFNELAEILPALVQQAVRAYQSGVIDRDVLKNGLEHFANPSLAKLVAPLVMRVLHTDMMQNIHQSSAALDCTIFMLQILSEKQLNDMDVAVSYVLNTAQRILDDMNTLISTKNSQKSTSSKLSTPAGGGRTVIETKLVDILSSLVIKLNERIHSRLPSAQPQWHSRGSSLSVLSSKGGDLRETFVKPNSSLAESAKTAISALLSWQVKPQGVPSVPTVIVSVDAKPVLGDSTLRNIIESVCFPQYPETAVALLVSDGLISKTSKLVDAGPSNNASETAQKFLDKFDAIFADRDSTEPPAVVVLANETPAQADTTASGLGNTPAALDGNQGASHTSQKSDASSFTSNPSPGMNLPFDVDMMMEEPDPIQGMNFDADFTSQPMNLDDLDSAMDFGWD